MKNKEFLERPMKSDKSFVLACIMILAIFVIGVIVGYTISQKQLWFWGIQKKQDKLALTIQQVKIKEAKLDVLLKRLQRYDKELCRLIEDLRIRPSEGD